MSDKDGQQLPPMTKGMKELMLATFLRDADAYLSIQDKLAPGNFSEYDQHYAVVWDAASTYYTQFHELPEKQWLKAEVESRVINMRADDDEIGTDAQLFIDAVFSLPKEAIKPEQARKRLTEFLKERLLDNVRAKILRNNHTPTRLNDIFAGYASEVESIDCIDSSPIKDAFSGDWNPEPLQVSPTGIGFIDTYLSGGQAPGEVYGLLGPYGSCKTLLCVQLSSQLARAEYTKWLASGKTDPLGCTYVFFYEGNPVDYEKRAMSFLARVEYERLLKIRPDKLSTTNNLQPYEMEMFAANLRDGVPVLGEQERIASEKAILRTNWRLIDMTGNDKEHPGRGPGLVPEIRNIIQSDLRRRPGTKVSGVFIDYVGSAAERHISHKGQDHKELRHIIGKFPMALVNNVATPFTCPVWALHQYAGDKNKNSPGQQMHHSMAAEARNFGENCAFCFLVGGTNNENIAEFSCSKHRRAPPMKNAAIRIDGRFCTVRDAECIFDRVSGQFVRPGDMKKWVSPDAVRAPMARPMLFKEIQDTGRF